MTSVEKLAAVRAIVNTDNEVETSPSDRSVESLLMLLADLVDAVEHAEVDEALDDPWDRENIRSNLAAANKMLGRS